MVSASRWWTGWTAVAVSTALSAFWAMWGGAENFHEGWYHREIWRNVGLMFVQYLPWMFLPMIAAVLALWKPVAGLLAHLALAAGVFALVGFRSAGALYLGLPIVVLGLLHLVGRPEPRRLGRIVLIAVPCLTVVVSSAYPGWRALTRPATVDESTRRIAGDGVSLVWAGRGPGWDQGVSWFTATDRCARLTPDGSTLASTPQHVWRLPTADEAVRSMSFRGRNSNGRWDPETRRATFRVQPDKEAPLWDPFSPVVYLWTSDDADTGRAYFVNFEGGVFPRRKEFFPTYQGYRCVKSGE
jgi:hypothetical protein